MTREEILAMEPGNKLDGMVSEVVFGKPPLQNWSRDGDNVVCSYMTYAFSTDISAAWKIIAHEQKEWSWDIWMYNEALEVGVIIGRGQAVSKNAAEAICKAALLNKWFQKHSLWGQGTTEALIPIDTNG